MIPRGMLRDTITVVKEAETGPPDIYNNPTMVTTSTTDVPAMVWPSGIPDELEIQRDTRISIYNVIVEPDVDINGISHIVWEGRTMKVHGEPSLFKARGLPHHFEIKVREIRG